MLIIELKLTKSHIEKAVRYYYGFNDWKKDTLEGNTKLGFEKWMDSLVESYLQADNNDPVFQHYKDNFRQSMYLVDNTEVHSYVSQIDGKIVVEIDTSKSENDIENYIRIYYNDAEATKYEI